MPNIVDLSVSCPSNCSLIGTSSVMRDFLLGKNLPQVPTDIIQAGLVNQWYNDGNLAPTYDNLDPQALIDIGNVLSDIEAMRIQHQNLNLYDDYEDDHYAPSQFINYTQYPLISIDDSAASVTMHDFGDIESWTDMEEALIQADTWETKWTFELGLNHYTPDSTYFNIPALGSHSDNIIPDISFLTTNIIGQFLTTNYNISSFIMFDNVNAIYTPLEYYQQLLEPYNKYKQTANDSYWPSYFGLSNYNYADPNLSSPNLNVNQTDDSIDEFTDGEGLNVVAFPTPDPQGAREWYDTTFNDYSIGVNYNPSGIGSYANGNVNFTPANDISEGFLPSKDLKDNKIDSLDNFTLSTPEFSSLNFLEGEPLTPLDILAGYCNYENIFGGTPEITSTVEIIPSNTPIYQYNTTPKLINCYSYVTSVTDPFTYGIQDSKEVSSNLLNPENLLQEYLPPQATINVGSNTEMNLSHYGVTSSIEASLGFVFPNMPVPLNAVLDQIDKNTADTPLGKTAKVKLASEFFNRIALNIRQEAFGMAEQIGQGLTTLAGNLVSSIVGSNKTSQSGLDVIVDAFRNHEITVPKSIIGKAANLISSLGGVNLKLDPIKEDIRWTTNVPKTDDEPIEFNDDPSTNKQSFWNKLTGLGKTSQTNDPSEILLAYTSSGQRQYISESLQLNEYQPYYQIAGFMDNGKALAKKQRKSDRLKKRIKQNNSKIDDYNKRIGDNDKEYMELLYTSPDSGKHKNKIKRLAASKFNGKFDDARYSLMADQLNEKNKFQTQIDILNRDIKECEQALNGLTILYPDSWYPIEDNGTFNGTNINSKIKSLLELAGTNQMDVGPIFIPVKDKNFAESSLNSNKTVYTYPIDDAGNVSRYRKDPTFGTSPETRGLKDGQDYNIYEKVSDLLKHGLKPDNSMQSDLRGLNIYSLDKPSDGYTTIGYNVYPRLEKGRDNILNEPGLGREDIYNGQSLFSVLERNGFVKVSPLWENDQVEYVADLKKKIEGATNTQGSYEEVVKIHRYMFSIENLAWKGFKQQLPWQERGPNGGRILWFPPYDLRVSDTTTVSLGSEPLIGRNEPVYTYNYTERSGVLNFKMIMDFPGYHYPNTTQKVDPVVIQDTQVSTTTNEIPPLIPPKSNQMDWWLDSDTFIYIIMDESGSMDANTAVVTQLFGNDGIFKKRLIDDKIYTEAQYQNRVFIFKDPGLIAGGGDIDNIDDGRFFAWFAVPYFMSLPSSPQETNTAVWYPAGGVPKTASPLPGRLIPVSSNVANLPTSPPQKVVVIALLNESSPAYFSFEDPTSVVPPPIKTRIYNDIVDFNQAKISTPNGLRGVILGYKWDAGLNQNMLLNAMLAAIFGGYAQTTEMSLSPNTQTNNMGIQAPPSISWPFSKVNYDWNSTTVFKGNYAGLPEESTNTVVPDIQMFPDIFPNVLYQFGINETNETNGVNGTDAGGEDSVQNIIYVLKKSLATDPNEVPTEIKPDEVYQHEKMSLLRKFISSLIAGNPNNMANSIYLVWGDTAVTEVTISEIKEIIGTSDAADESLYDIEFNKFFTTGINTKTTELSPDGLAETGILYVSADGSTTPDLLLSWFQEQGGGESNVRSTGEITSEGWALLMKILDPTAPEANNSSNPSGIPVTKPAAKPIQQTIPWGNDVPNMDPENQLNEFMYFKRLAQSDPIYRDTLKEKIVFFDPAFHSITPVGFNNRLNFLEQCARQGPSINNVQTEDGTIISANSNLAFGRPPISVLRIGDFYHTRIAIEGIDLQYEPLIFDMNPEGIGVQPMIADVTINFKYLGGSSLSGPITKLQNAIGNNYFANVEFYNTQALHASERNVGGISITTPQGEGIISDVTFTEPTAFDNSFNNGNEIDPGGTDGDSASGEQGEKNKDKWGKTLKCLSCPSGFFPYTSSLASLDNIEDWAYDGTLCVPINVLASLSSELIVGFSPCRNFSAGEIKEGERMAKIQQKQLKRSTNKDGYNKFVSLCKKMGCAEYITQ